MPRLSFLTSVLLGACLATPLLSAAPTVNPRLAQSASAYLRKQAEQPVAWYPWGEEAFEKARRENKLVLVSLGYSTCHWCHVMARESFSDAEVAEVLNTHFVCIKVDREERPDLDRRFISFLEQTQGSAGWPANLWLTPELTPFFGTGYLPKIDEAGSPGFLTLSRRLAELWQRDPATVLAQAKTVSTPAPTPSPAERTPFVGSLEAAWLASVRDTYDPVAGGFDPGPKFPNAVLVRSLLQLSTAGNPSPREMALHTLRRLARSGLHDVLGGGFHRYATDPEWKIPHFEKMLVDQAQLALAYTEAWCLTGEDEFKATVTSLIQGLDAFRLADGTLASALDADSPGPGGRTIEGGYYLWTWSELSRILSPDTLARLSRQYGLSAEGNVTAEGTSALHLNLLDPDDAQPWQVAAEGDLKTALEALRDARLERPSPFRDETVHAAYNALAVSALARAGVRLSHSEWIDEAATLGACLKARHWDPEARRLTRLARGAKEAPLAFADDYANTVAAALDLYEATSATTWLAWALELQRVQDHLFRLEPTGLYANETTGFHDGERRVDLDDRAEASPNSTTLLNLQRLAALTGDDAWRASAQHLFERARPALESAPASHPMILSAAQSLDGQGFTVLITGPLHDDNAQRLVKVAARSAAWSTATVRVTPGSWESLSALHPELTELLPDGALQTQAVVCAQRQCFAPTSDPSELARLLRLPPSHSP